MDIIHVESLQEVIGHLTGQCSAPRHASEPFLKKQPEERGANPDYIDFQQIIGHSVARPHLK
jgi:predicted ATPase with chaperone activity